MMRRRFFRLTVLVCCFSLMVLGGCVRTKPSKFYRLNAVSGSGPGAQTIDTGGELAIGVGPVKLPLYLDRPYILIRTSANEFDSSGFDRWTEPLKNNITNVLAENLSVLLATDRISVFPWTGSTELDYQVLVEHTRRKRGGRCTVDYFRRKRRQRGASDQQIVVERLIRG